jgi:hypothetical protein
MERRVKENPPYTSFLSFVGVASRIPEGDESSQRIPPVRQKLLASYASGGLHELIDKRLLNDFDTVGNAARDPQMHERRLAQ